MDIVETLRTFVRVVETGSLTAVAREMNTSQSKISRQITQLEDHFGLRLLHRTTRHLSLTDDGKGLCGHAANLLDVVHAMEASLSRHKSTPAGHVRVATPVSLGLWLIGRLPALTARYPHLSVELVMQEHSGDMIEERLDLAVRSGEVTNPSLVIRRLGTLTRIAVAAPAYLERRGSPCFHEDLTNHDCIVRRVSESDSEWRLTSEDGSVDVAVSGAVSTNSHEVARGAALRGLQESLCCSNIPSSTTYSVAACGAYCQPTPRKSC